MSKEKKYAIVYDKGDFIQCLGVYPYHEAVGVLVCDMADSLDSWKENDYTIEEREDFYPLDCDTGYGWYAKCVHKNPDIVVKENWYALLIEEKSKED